MSLIRHRPTSGVSQAGNVAKEVALNDNARDWQPFDPAAKTYQVLSHTIKGQVSTGLSGEYRVGIWMPEEQSSLKYDSRYAVKWATSDRLSHWQDPDGKYAVNIVGSVTF